MRSKKGKIIIALACIMTLGSGINADAHGGRTDGSGGHRDNKNKSGLGSYHYHCGGNPAHLHTNGCPYNKTPAVNKPQTGSGNSNGQSTQNIQKQNEERERKAKEAAEKREKEEAERIAKEKEVIEKKGYEAGKKDGYEEKENAKEKYTGAYKEAYVKGYNTGYFDGKNDFESEVTEARNKGERDGSEGKEENNTFTKKVLNEAYKNAYGTAHTKYIDKTIKEYEAKGQADAMERKEAENVDGIDSRFKEAYLSSYNTKKDQLDKEMKERINMMLGFGAVGVGATGGGIYIYKKRKKKIGL